VLRPVLIDKERKLLDRLAVAGKATRHLDEELAMAKLWKRMA
jgi:hypothetical protein